MHLPESGKTNTAILNTLGQWFNGRIALDEREGYCLGFITSVLQHALNLPITEFYDKYIKERADPTDHWAKDGPWARDAEKSLRALGMTVHNPMPGDLYFIWKDAKSQDWTAKEGHDVYIGHVAILLAPGLLIENVRPEWRPHSLHHGEIQLTPTSKWFSPSTIIRFDPGKMA